MMEISCPSPGSSACILRGDLKSSSTQIHAHPCVLPGRTWSCRCTKRSQTKKSGSNDMAGMIDLSLSAAATELAPRVSTSGINLLRVGVSAESGISQTPSDRSLEAVTNLCPRPNHGTTHSCMTMSKCHRVGCCCNSFIATTASPMAARGVSSCRASGLRLLFVYVEWRKMKKGPSPIFDELDIHDGLGVPSQNILHFSFSAVPQTKLAVSLHKSIGSSHKHVRGGSHIQASLVVQEIKTHMHMHHYTH